MATEQFSGFLGLRCSSQLEHQLKLLASVHGVSLSELGRMVLTRYAEQASERRKLYEELAEVFGGPVYQEDPRLVLREVIERTVGEVLTRLEVEKAGQAAKPVMASQDPFDVFEG